ncbi:uncharacterized protein K02A2.6-like [Aedes albopictus]|uniref:RNA-directed DNA polymerase n=1 Tax=Aedes albopictus TaxID=7160 RepID=A0ABM1YUU1_AEDAL
MSPGIPGQQVYQTVKNICYPAKPNTKTYDELCGLLKGRFCATVVTYRERALFYRARQEPDESVLEWHVRLKRLSLNCEFGEHLGHALKDIFVTGLRPGPIFERLCEEDDAVSLEDLLKIASKREATLKNRAVLEVNKIVEKKPNYVPKSFKKTGSATCYACGKANHDFRSCQYRSYVCKICKEKGHIAVVCPRKTKENLGRKDKTVNHLEINNMAYSDPYCVSISVNGRNTKFEVDTGSPITVISEEFYESQFGEFPLHPFQGKLVFYTGGEATPRGAFDAVLKYQGVQAVGQVVVVEGGRNPLIGRDFIGELLKIKFNKIDAEQTENLEERLKPVLNRYEDLFDDSLGCYKYSKVSLQLKPDAVPKFVKPRKIPISFQPKVEEELEKLEKTGIISKAENADWGTPLVPVLKKDNSIRLCADYRVTVNPFLEDKRYPMPVAEDIFAKLNGGKFFSKLDLKSAYNQLLLDEESKKMLAWSTHKGIYYRFWRSCCKICPGCVNFLDDVLVTGATIEEHLNNLSRVLEKLWDAGFRLNKGKCEFFKQRLQFLGHIVDGDGLHKDPEKVRAIMDVARPANVKLLREFLGMVTYYSKFIPNVSATLSPLYRLLKKDVNYEWTSDCEAAFQDIKLKICSDNVLIPYNPDWPVVLVTDASGKGIGAALFQVCPDGNQRPVTFISRVLKNHEKEYSPLDMEALAVYYAVRRLSGYLLGRNFTIWTDHQPLVSLFGRKGIPDMVFGKLQRWAVFLANYDYEIKYIKGVSNKVADFLSRSPVLCCEDDDINDEEAMYLQFIEYETRSLVERKQLIVETRRDPALSRVVNYVKTGWPTNVQDPELKKFFVRRTELIVEEEVMWGYRIVAPAKLRTFLLQELHSTHMGIVKMKSLARNYFWWPNIDKDIEDLGKRCEQCIQFRPESGNVPISPWKLCSRPFERVHIDHLFLKNKNFLIITDSYSKWVEVYLVSSLTTKETIEKLEDCFGRFGNCDVLVSDNGRSFTAAEFQEFCKEKGIRHLTSAPYSPCSNGAAENAVKTFKYALKKMLTDSNSRGKSLSSMMNHYLQMYRATPHCTTNETPFKLMFGREMRTRFDTLRKDNVVKHAVKTWKHNENKKDTCFAVGESVYARDYRDPDRQRWIKATISRRKSQNIYECAAAELGTITRRTHQLLKYDYDDYEDDNSGGRDPVADDDHEPVPDDEYQSAEDDAFDDSVSVQQQRGYYRDDGIYVSRSNRMVRAPDRF